MSLAMRIALVIDVEVDRLATAKAIANGAIQNLVRDVERWSDATSVAAVRYELDGDPTLVESSEVLEPASLPAHFLEPA